MKKKFFGLLVVFALIPGVAKAHCPLCTAGAGALAVGAAYIGVSTYVVGILIGAFALALSLWIVKLVKKKYIKHQKPILAALVFLSTILPLMPMMRHYTSVNIYWFGEYGAMFNRTYMFNRFLIGVIIGTLIMFVSPYLSRELSKLRNGKIIPYQGIAITFVLLFITSLIMQFAL